MRLIDADALMNEIRNSDDAKLDTIEAFLDMQPTITQWIPVSERLPNDNKRVLVSVKMDGDEWTDVDCIARYGGTLAEPWDNYPSYTVLAWAPLPEPMRLEENDG